MRSALGEVSTRDRMIDSTIVLLRERGANAVTLDAVLAHGEAPRGSLYHHFPGGRDELVLAALKRSGQSVSGILDSTLSTGEVMAAVRRFIDFWKRALRESDYRAGCPIANTAVDSQNPVPEAAAIVVRTFAEWDERLVTALVAEGYPRPRAHRLATTIVAAIEGALLMCRAQRTTGPLDDVASEIHVLLEQR